MAVLTSTAAAPHSMQRTASLGTPSPASTTTGTSSRSMISLMLNGFWMPSVVPIGAAPGMTAAAPTSCRRSASTTSSLV